MLKKLIISLFIVFSVGAYAVGIKQCLFSEMTGVVSFEGKPAAGVKLVRLVNKNKDIIDETITDEDGNFTFPAVFTKSYLSKILPTEFVVYQNITAYFNDQEFEVWSGVKRTPDENAESRGKPLVVKCNLSQPDVEFVSIAGTLIHSRCTWDVEPDPKRNISYF